MAQVSGRTGFNGSALVRLLSRLSQVDVREPRQVTADRLSQWFGWTDAISLSAALNGTPAASTSGARASTGKGADAEANECNRVRAALTSAIVQDSTFVQAPAAASTASSRTPKASNTPKALNTPNTPNTPKAAIALTPGPEGPKDIAIDPQAAPAAPLPLTDFAPYRQRYLARQQAMDAAVGPLRGRLRARLAGKSPAMARLAAVDVVMEQVLGAQERSLLGSVPTLLEKHFKRLRQAAPEGWLDAFHQDARDVLLAELELRFQPVDGLLEALRAEHKDIPQ